MGTRLAIAVTAASLAGLLFGFDTAVIAGVTATLRDLYHLSPTWLGFTVAAALFGTIPGAALGAVAGGRIGSRDGLRVAAAFYLVSGIGCALANSWAALVGFRFLCGVAVGASSVMAPIYLAEIAPAKRRGLIVGMFQVNIVVGILLAYVSNATVASLVETGAWRWKLGLTAVPALVFFILMFVVPASPRWLAARGRAAAASAASLRLYGTDISTAFPASAEAVFDLGHFWHTARRPILLAATLGALNQLTGINAILYYTNDIFAAAGFGRISGDLQSIAIGSMNLVSTLVAMAVIDRLGRRQMLLIGSGAMAALLGVAAAVMFGLLPQSWLLAVLVLFIAAFAFSQGAVIWVYISEIFPTQYRAAGQGVGAATIWLFDAMVTFIYPIAAARSKGMPFAFFMAVMIVQFFVVRAFFAETKGQSLEALGETMAA